MADVWDEGDIRAAQRFDGGCPMAVLWGRWLSWGEMAVLGDGVAGLGEGVGVLGDGVVVWVLKGGWLEGQRRLSRRMTRWRRMRCRRVSSLRLPEKGLLPDCRVILTGTPASDSASR